MKRTLLLFLFLNLAVIITGCNSKFATKDVAELNEIETISMHIKKNTLSKTKATIIITDKSDLNYIYGEAFRLDKKIDNQWQEITPLQSPDFNAKGYYIDNKNTLTMEQDWSNLYGELEKGEYRIVKYIYDDNNEKKYFSTEFDIS